MSQDKKRIDKVLIVDDEKFVLKILADTLSNLCHDIIFASNGQEALEKIQTTCPDLIISDIMMPVMNGIDLLKAIRENQQTCHLPFILLTVKDATLDILDGYHSGADYYLPKPFDYNQLVEALDFAIAARKEKNDRT
ncbi:response regulator [bacterium]|nr:response regulator [bacterium]